MGSTGVVNGSWGTKPQWSLWAVRRLAPLRASGRDGADGRGRFGASRASRRKEEAAPVSRSNVLREAGLGGVGEQRSGRGSRRTCRNGHGEVGRRIVKLLCPSHRMRDLLTRATRREMFGAGETVCEEEEEE